MSRFSSFVVLLYVSATLATPLSAQSRLLVENETLELGQVQWKHPLTFEYSVANDGNQPLVLTEVSTSCECAVADWTKNAIVPGGKGTITLTFQPDMLGRFEKYVGVYSNAEPHLQYFRFTGTVVEQVTDFARTHPFEFGRVRLTANAIEFPDAHRDEHPEVTIGVANQSGAAYEPVLMHLPSYIQQTAIPAVLQAGEQGIIKLTLQSERLDDLGLMQETVYLSRFEGDKVGDDNEIPLSAVLLPDASMLKNDNPPTIQLSETEVDLRATLAKKNKASHNITIRNTGASPLTIAKLQVFNPAVEVSLRKTVVNPGESTRLRVKLDKRHIRRQMPLRILLITDDPQHPKVTINIRTNDDESSRK
ncbi:MAG: DUF1573 domain-containing protein [Prevotellaceae bacterium]|jgi:hypothetical protein|nr:DUF1573 domain-containing protein [Prevotellaceae bacterium]